MVACAQQHLCSAQPPRPAAASLAAPPSTCGSGSGSTVRCQAVSDASAQLPSLRCRRHWRQSGVGSSGGSGSVRRIGRSPQGLRLAACVAASRGLARHSGNCAARGRTGRLLRGSSTIASAAGAERAGRSLEFATLPLPGRCGMASFSPAAGVAAPGLQQRLAGLGLAGVLAYGLLNTAWYTVSFYFVWRYIARVPRGLGLAATAAKFAEVIGLTWGGSQLTKVPRAAGAIALAPAVDALLSALQGRLRLRTRRAAFGVALAACLCTAAVFYGCMLLAWA